ncbi:enoyl-CoA hydratase/isomerase family protein [Paenactinomyces guangxiensis]|uniref:Enoyl-CoA hydratase/isomerase family protein n=1 Tax=Paenactinomyces guangxiensis TaxID=1490290 RepID=A0A7W1WSP8_9BACL|nr:enoyl-CoA hydratase-related protein [Paenactinomyces guangxiensis]MBA4495355.1 enoyl-CoA hydratase/isomerase family protein [Paenactinomyces guangxiensis]MBH8592524.1 enoyl-CoA hydratase/isomerase family protein [Paenactinomyces guangxiensis]
MSNWKHIRSDQGEGWVLLTLSRPKVLNALNRELLEELNEAVDWIEKTDSVRVVIITGSGEKAFVAGADISEFNEIKAASQAEQMALRGQSLFRRIENLHKPVIMAVNGYALGGGCELAMCGDIILAAENARFGQPEVNLGIIPGYGGTQRLARAVGKNMAKYLCMTGEMITAAEAQRLGLVQKIVPAPELIKEAKQLAGQLAQKAPLAIQLIKKSIHNGLDVDLGTGLQLEASYFGLSFNTEDRTEGVNAFLEKRAPRFKGK